MTLRKKLKDNPEIMKDIKEMMTLLVDKLPESELYNLDWYYGCVQCGIVSEMLEMKYYTDLDVDYFSDRVPFDKGRSIFEIKKIIRTWFKLLRIEEYDYETGFRRKLLNTKIKSLDFDENFKEFATSNGYYTFEDILPLTVKDFIIYQREKRFDATEVVSKISEIIQKDKKKYGEIYTIENHPGKSLCNTMRDIRKKIAKANNIPFESVECHNSGPCRGTCPACDAEIKYLNEQIEEKLERGERIRLAGIAKDDIKKAGCEIYPEEKEVSEGSIGPYDSFPFEKYAELGDA